MQYLPVPLPRTDDQTVTQYGLGLFRFVLATGVTATLSDVDLELASYAGVVASTGSGMEPRTYDRISHARLLILRALETRKALQEAPEPEPCVIEAPEPGSRPNDGPMAPLSPAPKPRSPEPVRVPVIAF